MKLTKPIKYTRLLTALLSLIGFASSCNDGLGNTMYGTPPNPIYNYKINTRSVNKDFKPVSNISIRFSGSDTEFRTDNTGHTEALSDNIEMRTDSIFFDVRDDSKVYKDSIYKFKIDQREITYENRTISVNKEVIVVLEKQTDEQK